MGKMRWPGWPARCLRLSLVLGAVAAVAASGATAASLITGAQVKNSSLTGADIRNKSLTSLDFQGSVRGPAGAQGPAGPAGTVAGTTIVTGPRVAMTPAGSGSGAVQSSAADCPPGTIVTGGGWNSSVFTFVATAIKSGNGYFVIAINDSPLDSYIEAQAICGTAPGAATTLARAHRTATSGERSRQLDRVRELAARRG